MIFFPHTWTKKHLSHRFLQRTAAVLGACIGVLFSMPSQSAAKPPQYSGVGVPAKEHVVLLHGITAGSWHTKPLADFLTQKGYDVISIDYPSTKYPLEELIEIECKDIHKKLFGKFGAVHFVGHSMGGLLIRGMLKTCRPAKLGRVVMIGTPNHGSESADLLKDTEGFRFMFGPAGQQLTTHNAQVDKLLGLPDYPVGIIAGVSSDGTSMLGVNMIPGDDDGMVSVESTKLEGMSDFIIVYKSEHLLQPMNEEVQNATANYLKYGKLKGLADVSGRF